MTGYGGGGPEGIRAALATSFFNAFILTDVTVSPGSYREFIINNGEYSTVRFR